MRIGTLTHKFSSCPSTNDLARRLAEEGAEEGTVVMADEQTAGRGTKGRAWHSPRSRGFYLSVILRPPGPYISLLSCVAGLAVVDAVREGAGVEAKLKWPNDIIAAKKKLGGILLETSFLGKRLNYAILGIGLNLDQRPEDFPGELRDRATSLALLTGKAPERQPLLAALWSSLDRWYGAFCAGERRKILESYGQELIFPVGKAITVSGKSGPVTGSFAGIDPRGGLILKKGKERVCFYSGEVESVDYE